MSCAGYVPRYRLDRSQIGALLGSAGGKGTRSVASYDEDTTTMGFEAARLALRATPGTNLDQLLFSTVTPAYTDRTNATAIHAALRLDPSVVAVDLNGSVRSAAGGLRLALRSSGTSLIVHADARDGLPTSGDEAAGGDGAAAALIGGSDTIGPLIAEYLGGASITDEFVDRWRQPGDARSKLWEERFGEIKYLGAGTTAWQAALADAGLSREDVDIAVVSGLHAKAVRSMGGRLGAKSVADDRSDTIGNAGAAQPLLLLTDAIERSQPGQVIALVVLSDGADVFVFRTTDAVAAHSSTRPVAQQATSGAPLSYGKFLSWRGRLAVEPPRRPEPARVSSSAADRNEDWKFGFVATRDSSTGTVEMPPARMSNAGPSGSLEAVPMAEAQGTIATYTIDRMAYSPSPPVVFAVVDFDGGGRLPVDLTDVTPEEATLGGRVEMTFRRLAVADGISNYFWKARPVRDG